METPSTLTLDDNDKQGGGTRRAHILGANLIGLAEGSLNSDLGKIVHER